MADRTTTGMPLLSGRVPPPHSSSRADISCRRCNKEFNIVFTRARRCNHCGACTRFVLSFLTYLPPCRLFLLFVMLGLSGSHAQGGTERWLRPRPCLRILHRELNQCVFFLVLRLFRKYCDQIRD